MSLARAATGQEGYNSLDYVQLQQLAAALDYLERFFSLFFFYSSLEIRVNEVYIYILQFIFIFRGNIFLPSTLPSCSAAVTQNLFLRDPQKNILLLL